MALIDAELSEPYSIFTYRYFLDAWPDLCFLAYVGGEAVGTVVCKVGECGGGEIRAKRSLCAWGDSTRSGLSYAASFALHFVASCVTRMSTRVQPSALTYCA